MADHPPLVPAERLLNRLAAIISILIALTLPALFAFVGFDRIASDLNFRAHVIASQIAVFANIQGDTWRYSSSRLPELVAIGDPDEVYGVRISSLSLGQETIVLSLGPEQAAPTYTVRKTIVVRGNDIGIFEITASIRSLMINITLMLVGSTAIGVAFYFVFNRVPMKLLRHSISELERSQDNLADEVKLKNIEATRANEASHAKSSFLAQMSHEMRTPLNAIIGFSEIMKAQMFGSLPDAYLNYTKDINDSGQHLLELVNALLDLSKLEQHQVEITADAASIHEIITKTVSIIREQAKAKDINITTLIDRDVPQAILTDRGKLFQALINIAINAVNYTKPQGRIKITARPYDDGFEISVEDNGIGMTAAEIGIALEPFGQVRNVFTNNTKGTGLGLPIAKSFIELLQGTLEITSKPSVGTKVTLRLPTSYADSQQDQVG